MITIAICIDEASYITVLILQKFLKIRSRDSRAWRERMGLTLFNDNGVVVSFEKG